MILEIAQIDVARGCRGMELHRSTEKPGLYQPCDSWADRQPVGAIAKGPGEIAPVGECLIDWLAYVTTRLFWTEPTRGNARGDVAGVGFHRAAGCEIAEAGDVSPCVSLLLWDAVEDREIALGLGMP